MTAIAGCPAISGCLPPFSCWPPFCWTAPGNILRGLRTIVYTEDALITDYIAVAGPGAALCNAALVTAITLCLLYFSNETFNGTTQLEVGLMSGFALFGKNFVNIWPILAGSFLYARFRREPLGTYIHIGLLTTALSPLVSYIALDNGWGNVYSAVAVGVLHGFIMPPLSSYTYRIQNGMNLYNAGFACGLVAMILVPLMSSLGADPTVHYNWATGDNRLFAGMLSGLCLVLILCGLFCCRKPVWAAWAGLSPPAAHQRAAPPATFCACSAPPRCSSTRG